MSKYLQPNESGLFDKAIRLEELHAMGDPLARLDEVIDWTLFEAVFERIPKAEPKGLGGRPAFAPAMMFKALVIQNLDQLSDQQLPVSDYRPSELQALSRTHRRGQVAG